MYLDKDDSGKNAGAFCKSNWCLPAKINNGNNRAEQCVNQLKVKSEDARTLYYCQVNGGWDAPRTNKIESK